MRVSSLSDDKVNDLLSKYFIPAWISRQHYQLAGPADSEQEELHRIDKESVKRGLEDGTVCVFIIAPNGSILASMKVQKASKPENLAPFLQKIVDDQKLEPRKDEDIRATKADPHETSKPATDGGRMLRVWARFAERHNRQTAEDWAEWKADDWSAIAPAADAKPGATLTVSKEAANRLFQRLYPPGDRWGVSDCEVTGGGLTATVVSVEGGEVRLKLDGDVSLNYPISDKKADGKVTAHLVGAARYDTAKKTYKSFELASDTAEYVWNFDGKPQHQKLLMAVEMEP
jgi:hypothetical protein